MLDSRSERDERREETAGPRVAIWMDADDNFVCTPVCVGEVNKNWVEDAVLRRVGATAIIRQ